jgi:FAD/FMN-containing dehydrogenase
MKKFTRRTALFGTGAAIGVVGARAFSGKVPVLDGIALAPPTPEGIMNDASGLSPTPVSKHIVLTEDPGEALVARLRAELAEAQAAGRPACIGAARHSMGAQAIPEGGHAITLDNATVEVDTAQRLYRAHAGARWSDVIAALDPLGLSPKVMQSNHDFGVAATFSVNAHGWPVPFGPMGTTVRSLTMMLADGSLVTCSPTENADLFGHAMGGYGLAGFITGLEVEAAENQRLDPTFQALPAADFAAAFSAAVNDGAVTMAYGRLNVDKARFFEDALLITYRPSADQSDLPAASGSGWLSRAASRLYRWQLGNERMKRVRWGMETGPGARAGSDPVTRNSLINEPVATLDDRDPTRTDILHEYFVAPDRFGAFLELCRQVIPNSYQEMLNVTLRYVAPNPDAWLTYAPVSRIAAVMSFSQEMTARAEADMARMTRDMIDGIVALGGHYYLPYRPHATVEQFRRAYPRAGDFAAFKRQIDPALSFRNGLWDNYAGFV